jgi:hypothetical protein
MFCFCSMLDGATTADRHAPILAELAELGLSLARAVHEKALAAETPAELAEMTLAFHRISRSVRQTLALEAKLERDRARRDLEVRAEADRGRQEAAERRKRQVRIAVERTIWAERESYDEAERLIDELDDILTEEALSDEFLAGPVEAHIERIRQDLGLSGAPADAPAKDAAPAESGRRSSA